MESFVDKHYTVLYQPATGSLEKVKVFVLGEHHPEHVVRDKDPERYECAAISRKTNSLFISTFASPGKSTLFIEGTRCLEKAALEDARKYVPDPARLYKVLGWDAQSEALADYQRALTLTLESLNTNTIEMFFQIYRNSLASSDPEDPLLEAKRTIFTWMEKNTLPLLQEIDQLISTKCEYLSKKDAAKDEELIQSLEELIQVLERSIDAKRSLAKSNLILFLLQEQTRVRHADFPDRTASMVRALESALLKGRDAPIFLIAGTAHLRERPSLSPEKYSLDTFRQFYQRRADVMVLEPKVLSSAKY